MRVSLLSAALSFPPRSAAANSAQPLTVTPHRHRHSTTHHPSVTRQLRLPLPITTRTILHRDGPTITHMFRAPSALHKITHVSLSPHSRNSPPLVLVRSSLKQSSRSLSFTCALLSLGFKMHYVLKGMFEVARVLCNYEVSLYVTDTLPTPSTVHYLLPLWYRMPLWILYASSRPPLLTFMESLCVIIFFYLNIGSQVSFIEGWIPVLGQKLILV